MSDHALYSPSSAARWMGCAGSVVLHTGSADSEYSAEGTAAHDLAARCLRTDTDAHQYIGETLVSGKFKFEVDEDFADAVQMYLNDCRGRGVNCYTMVEVRVDLSESLGVPAQFGTSDFVAVAKDETHVAVEDLKFGRGVKVYAERNEQGMEYALGVLEALVFAGFDIGKIENVTIIICQPRLDHIDEWTVSMEALLEFQEQTRAAVQRCEAARLLPVGSPEFEATLTAGEKQCRWCSAKATCNAAARYVSQAVFNDFEAIDDPTTMAKPAPKVPTQPEVIGQRMGLLDFIHDWCAAVRAEGERMVLAGTEVIGTDGKPYKIVQGKKGKREWGDKAVAEAALMEALPPEKIYKPQEIITASVAAKLIDKGKTKDLWTATFKPLITQAPGALSVVPGSDPRPVYDSSAKAEDFDDLST